MTQNQSELQVCYAEYFVGDHKVRATLQARPQGLTVRYEIVLEQDGEIGICDLGTDACSARDLYMRVVWGAVSLCTLADVVQDHSGTLF